jgi:hypothetical protein
MCAQSELLRIGVSVVRFSTQLWMQGNTRIFHIHDDHHGANETPTASRSVIAVNADLGDARQAGRVRSLGTDHATLSVIALHQEIPSLQSVVVRIPRSMTPSPQKAVVPEAYASVLLMFDVGQRGDF